MGRTRAGRQRTEELPYASSTAESAFVFDYDFYRTLFGGIPESFISLHDFREFKPVADGFLCVETP